MLFDPKWKETEVDETGQLLLRAADYMQKHGWCVGGFENAKGEVCIFGAIMKTGGRYTDASWRLNCYLDEHSTSWNDIVCQSKEQAVAALRAAAYHK